MSLHPSVIKDAARQLEAAARRLRFLEHEWRKPSADRTALARALHEARSLTHAALARFEDGDLPAGFGPATYPVDARMVARNDNDNDNDSSN